MTSDPGQSAVDAAIAERRRQWRRGWRRWVFPGIWLVYLGQAVGGVSAHSSGAAAVAGYLIIVAFAGCYLVALPAGWDGIGPRFWGCYVAGFALTAVVALFAHQDAFVFFVYLGVLSVAAFRERSVAILAAMALITLVVPALVPSWHAHADFSDAFAIGLVGLAMYGFFSIIESNIALTKARAEVARLAAENERSRIARDLHDLLGHSLTTITVKVGLARRLAERGEEERSLSEIREVETLSRRTLADVRAAVAGHRDVTLAGELATAREVLRAAAIIAELPGSVDVADPARSELFGWVVREAVTNVVRHSRATHCTITLGRNWIEIADDGRGGADGAGNGLLGLRERVAAAGGTAHAGGTLSGWRVRVDVPAVREPARGECAETPTIVA